MMDFIMENRAELLEKTLEHFYISIFALVIGIVIAVPLGILIAKNKRLAGIILTTAGVLQTIPTLALLALMIPLFGIGKTPAIIALAAYILLPMLNNTIIGVQSISGEVKEAAKSMGMTNMQLMRSVDFPLALPYIMSGVRLSSVYVISWATLASYIGAGGLGDYVFQGLNLYEPVMILVAAILVTAIALITDVLLSFVERWSVPKGLKVSR
ncbi:ABC transporter permease [Salinicoccus kekensis]|uniref:Osmoprotectant transport system permease protein n=1 Tax=Salinicoccus kekensis TaxID=714307 RepID=A0A285UGI4_9STAP|nr:ABC transporter permease [Salinicoccus kekensis]SOC39381.1 osmoprotectant transport system permease protein [Salinicoccus kekensis]